MNETLRRCLDDLEARIVPEEEERLLGEWIAFSEGRFQGDLFSPRRTAQSPPRTEWPDIRVNEAIEDFDRMALQQYKMCSDLLANGGGTMMAVRSNYGTDIIPSLFGVKLFIMPDEMNTLPTNWPLPDTDAIRKAVVAGVPDCHGGWGRKAFEMGQRFKAIGREYSKIGRYVTVYHPDLQGPMDICELLWGSRIFYAVIEEPQLVHELLEVVTETYVAFLQEWETVAPLRSYGNVHWGYFHKGKILLRDDSAMNLSPDMYDEFMRPYDQRLLAEFGGGAIHFCGKGDHFIPRMCRLNGLFAINLSQPELNDMEVIFQHTVDKGINILELPRWAAEQALARGRDLRGRVSC